MAYEIALEMPGLEKALSGFDKVAEKLEVIRDQIKGAGQDASSIGRGVGGRAGGGGGGILGGGGGKSWSDSWARLDNLQLQRRLAEMDGYAPDDLKGLDVSILRAKRNVSRDQKLLETGGEKTQAEKLMDAVMTSRLGFSGGKMQVMPLVNKLASAGLIDPQKIIAEVERFANIGAMVPMITKLAIPAAIAAAGVVAGGQLVENAASSMRAGSGAYWTAGGNSAQTGQVAALGGFIGLTAQQAAEKAVEFGERLRGGGYGAAYMRSKGIMDQGVYTVNKATNYLKAIDEIRNIKNDVDAIRVARDLGMTSELQYRDLSSSTYNRLKRSMGDYGSPEERRQEAEYRANKEIFGNFWNQFVREAGGKFMGGVNAVMSGDMLKTPGSPQWMSAMVNMANMAGLVGPMPINLKNPYDKAGGDPIKENTQALKDLGRVMKDQAEQMGGGPRSRGALPAAQRYMQLENSMQSQALQLGAFHI